MWVAFEESKVVICMFGAREVKFAVSSFYRKYVAMNL